MVVVTNEDAELEEKVGVAKKLQRTDADDDAVPERVKTQVPQWRTVFCLTVLFIAVVVIMALPRASSEARAGVVIATTALLWCTESMPLMITALVPAILFPFAGVLTTKAAAATYFNDISLLMLGTFLMAESIEACGLHRRIALKILSLLGHGEALLMLGAILTTWKLSMFMSNTATTAMMLPIIGAIINSLRQIQREGEKSGALKMDTIHYNGDIELETNQDDDSEDVTTENDSKHDSADFRWFCKGLILAIPYGASIGGIATLTGTPPNLVFKSYYDSTFVVNGAPTIDYGTWMAFAYPTSFLVVVVGWHVLVLMYARNSYIALVVTAPYHLMTKWLKGTVHPETAERTKWRFVNKAIRKKYRELGPFRFPEVVLLFTIVLLVLLWLLRDPTGIKGWAVLHYDLTHAAVKTVQIANDTKLGSADKAGDPFLTDSWVVVLLGILLFNIPTDNPLQGTWLFKPPPGKKFTRSKKLLTWEIVMYKTPWDVLILLGGGYCIANGCEKSGLSKWLGDSFSFLEGKPAGLIALVIATLVACLTEVASNTASTTLFMPIIGSMAKTLKINPVYLLTTGCISASLAFCLPSATGPNAMVFSFKEIRVLDMLRTGVFMNVLSILIVVMGMSTWTRSILGITDQFPDWAK